MKSIGFKMTINSGIKFAKLKNETLMTKSSKEYKVISQFSYNLKLTYHFGFRCLSLG